jgi:exonuclease SbcC
MLEVISGDLKDKLYSLGIQYSELSKNVVESKTSLAHYRENKEKLKREVLENKGKLDKKKFLDEYFHWFNQYYLPSSVNIENHVLELLRRRFNEHFQNWFDILVDDPSLTVNVDELFSPRITRNTHVQDYAQLSGGERTSIAFAYRLALNTIVREVSFDKPVDLLILDEPTEGFSKEQLFKLRGVLDKVDCAQIIIVSHEQELDGLVDQIYFVENNYGISCVKTV